MSSRTTYSNFHWYKLQILVTFRKTSAFTLMFCSLFLPAFGYFHQVSIYSTIRLFVKICSSFTSLTSSNIFALVVPHVCTCHINLCILNSKNDSLLVCFLKYFVHRCANPNSLEGQRSPGPLHERLTGEMQQFSNLFVFAFVISESDPDSCLIAEWADVGPEIVIFRKLDDIVFW